MTPKGEHYVREGRHNYTPGHGNFPKCKNGGFDLKLMIPPSAYFDPTKDGPLGVDGKDWNKAAGISFIHPLKPSTWRKNAASAIIAWRPNEVPGMFELAAYTNDNKAKWTVSEPILVAAYEILNIEVRVDDDVVTYNIKKKEFKHKIEQSRWCIPIGPWFGGNRKSPNDHYLHAKMNII